MARGPRGEKRPPDVIGAAIKVAKIATGELTDERSTKSGRVRSGEAGASARAEKLSPERRSEIATEAASIRWSGNMRDLQKEIDANFEFLQGKLPVLVGSHRNRFALLRKQEIVGIYDTVRDAKMTGDRFFSDGIFSVQQIDDGSLELGFYSHAVHLGDTQ